MTINESILSGDRSNSWVTSYGMIQMLPEDSDILAALELIKAAKKPLVILGKGKRKL